jgi:hypothetical protein
MLKCIHQFSSKHERKTAFNAYRKWKNNQTYTHTTIDEDGNPEERQCTRYIAHSERVSKKSTMDKGI